MATTGTASYPPTNHSDPQPTLRAVFTGLVIGAILAPCNIYSGLKIGWAFNMSIAAALIGLAVWRLLQALGQRPFGMLENVMNQTTASAAASIVSSGLAAPIPALTLITGKTLSWWWLSCWLLAVSLLGVVVAAGIRRQMLLRERLVFPAGVATAETLREIYAHGREAVARVQVLASGAVVAAAFKFFHEWLVTIPRLSAGIYWPGRQASWQNLGFALDPSLLMIGFGAIIGLRVGLSLLLGAVIAWGCLAPWIIQRGWVETGAADAVWFGELVEWLLWPGVALMVSASLTTVVAAWWRRRYDGRRHHADAARGYADIPRRWFAVSAVLALVIAVVAQAALFDIAIAAGIAAVLLSFGLAVVAARVAGETGITPIGAVGKVTQVAFAWISPANVTNNLMAANVTGGATDQCADMLHDFKAGLMLGAQPRLQMLAQAFGICAGALAGSAAYLILIPDPQAMLLTSEWPAPAVATWKAVAEVLHGGPETLPVGVAPAMAIAAVIGMVMAWLATGSGQLARWLPSASALGLAFVIPAWNAMSLCIGAVLAALVGRYARGRAGPFSAGAGRRPCRR
ncbi:MAG: OPT family oligopeptide transporter [Gammaproteobacteria bacterium]|nr:OPT family oligopeptide transporter [Gammaproteobacteria bacterium]